MKKIIIIGSPGAGKSVFSKKLKEIIQLPLYHLDMLYHKNDGTHISKEELEEKLKNIFKEENWIIDGNYQRTLELRLKECDTVFLLDFPTDICIKGAESRIGKKRDDMPWVEEKFDEEFKNVIIKFSSEKLPQIYSLLDKYKDNTNIIIFKTREESDNYIKEISTKYCKINENKLRYTYNKLVRDKIPKNIDNKPGKKSKYRILSDTEYLTELNKKVLEEANEFIEENSIEELGDLMEVLNAIMKLKGYKMEDVYKVMKDKADKNGAFDNKIYLEYVDEEKGIS